MTSENLIERLRAANAVAAESVGNEALFAQIVASPGDRRLIVDRCRPRRKGWPLALVGLAALVVCAAAWAATGFSFTPFGDGSSGSTPADLRAAFLAAYGGGEDAIDPASIAAIGTFTTSGGEITVNAARAANGRGFVTQYVDSDGRVVTYMGYSVPTSDAAEIGKRPIVSSNSLNGMFDGVWQIWGIAPAGTQLELHFQDGRGTAVPMHDGLFVYLVGGASCRPGHRPSLLTATDPSGNVIGRVDPQVTDC